MASIPEGTQRLFFAAMPDAVTLAHAVAAAKTLALNSSARLVGAENYHVTVAFIGNVPESQLATLVDIGGERLVQPFSIRFDAFDYWPKPEVVVAAARTTPAALTQLWEQLHERLAVHGWALDRKRLRPHVTLARKVLQAPVLQAMSAFDWPVRELSLMRSDTSGAQSAYTVVASWPLLYERG